MFKPTEYGDERNNAVLAMLEDVHSFLVPIEPFEVRDGEVLIDRSWRVVCEAELFGHIAVDLADALALMGAQVVRAAELGAKQIVLRHDARIGTNTVNVNIADDAVFVTASSVRDMWRGVVWLERQMAWRHAPVLPRGQRVLRPRFERRITTSMFAMGLEKADDPFAYTDDYLRNMAHLGYTQLFLYIDLWEFCRSDILPQLAHPEAAHNIAEMVKLAHRAERFGLELVLMVAAPRIQPEHPLFTDHPELKGGIVMRTTGHALCTSQPLTHRFYAEQMRNLVKAIPNIGAMAYLIGGEGFLHCYTRAVPRTAKVTNCPRCAERRPSDVLAPLCNAVVAAVKEVSPDCRVMFWPYTSFIWTHEEPTTYDYREDLDLVRALDPRATWLLEIEKDAVIEIEETGTTIVGDYSIQFIGPSHKMKLTVPVLQQSGVELAVKTEVCCDAAFSSMPYIPVMHRWLARQRAIHALPTPVSWETWRFNGFWQAPSIEIAYWLDIEPDLTDEQVLRRVACRIYGEAAAAQVIDGWRDISSSWDTFYRHYGTYWTGPLVLGPSHPYDLGVGFTMRRYYEDGFYQIIPGMRESEDAEYLSDPRNLMPRFAIMPVTIYQPRHKHLQQVVERYRPGLEKIQAAMAKVPTALRGMARDDLDIVAMTYMTVLEDVEFHRFVKLRDEMNYLGKLDPQRAAVEKQIQPILGGGVERAERALEIVKRMPFMGWGYTFATRFTAAMIEDKLAKTRGMLDRLAGGSLDYSYKKPPRARNI